MLFATSAWAGFDFGECKGAKSFEQHINYYNGDYENAVNVGVIPRGVQGLKITLVSESDVDIRLYGEYNDKIVHWPKGLLSGGTAASTSYKSVTVKYSGYYGVDGKKGHEYIEIDGTLPVDMTMKAFGYQSGNAVVKYSWTGKENCSPSGGSGSFAQEVKHKSIATIGDVPADVNNFEAKLSSSIDLDIQLYGEDGTAIVAWPRGLLSSGGVQHINYHGMNIEWSGYKGTNGQSGNEYIKITGKTTEKITMKVYGYEAGYANVSYSWKSNNEKPVAMGQSLTTSSNDNIKVSLSGTDKDNDPLTYNITSSPMHGTLSGKAPNLTYSPDPGYSGSDWFKFNVDDGTDKSSKATVFINITESNTKVTELPLLVVRIEFNDFQFINSASQWSRKIFGNQHGQLNEYYNEVSYGKFKFKRASEYEGVSNDGIVTVHINKNHVGDDYNRELLVDALDLVDSYINFAPYDKNNDGALSVDELAVMFIVAGGEKALGMKPGVWAHSSCLNSPEAPLKDGKKILDCMQNAEYAIIGERHFNHDATIGVMAHEFGHAVFDLPDLYDVSGHSAGIGRFGLMSRGMWGSEPDEDLGETPVHMIGWSKIKANFVEPIVVSSSKSDVSLHASQLSGFNIYKIPTKHNGEYFLVENRGMSGYDVGLVDSLVDGNLGDGGLLITHIDENVNGNENVSHKLVDVEEASNAGLDSMLHGGHMNNLYFEENSNLFDGESTPNSNLNSGHSSGISVTNISEAGDIMTADININ